MKKFILMKKLIAIILIPCLILGVGISVWFVSRNSNTEPDTSNIPPYEAEPSFVNGQILQCWNWSFQNIKDNLDKIEEWTKEALELYESNYGYKASLGIRHIPAKYYDDLYFPEGNYEALTITIGEGKGQNWWCVVFPPLCLVDSGGNPSDVSEEEMMVDQEQKIILKSSQMNGTLILQLQN